MNGQMTIFDFMQPDDLSEEENKNEIMEKIKEAELLKGNNIEDGLEKIFRLLDRHSKKGGNPQDVVDKIRQIFLGNNCINSGAGRTLSKNGKIIGHMSWHPGGILFEFYTYQKKTLMPWPYVTSQYYGYYWSGKLKGGTK